MKKLYSFLFIAVFLFCSTAHAQYVNIADTAFRAYLKWSYPSCFNAADQLDTVCAAIQTNTSFDFDYTFFTTYPARSVDGIQYFKKLQLFSIIECYGEVRSIPKFPPNLKSIDLFGSYFTSLPPFPDSVEAIDIGANLLTSLPQLPSSLTILNCDANPLASLPPLPAGLIILNCSNDTLITLPALPSTLKTLTCYKSKLTALPALPSSLTNLDCSQNKLTALPSLPSALLVLHCSKNNIGSLPALPSSLRELDCSYNNISNIPVLPNTLHRLYCNRNVALTSLPGFPSTLDTLRIDSTGITCLPVLPNAMRNLTLDTNVTKCIPNTNPNLVVLNGVRSMTPRLCNVTNNLNGCIVFPFVSGRVFYDLNNNSTREPNEPYKAFSKIYLSNGNYTFTNDSGYYEVVTDVLGSLTLTPVNNTPFFIAAPTSASFNFSSYDTAVSKDFAYHPTVIKDSVAITLTPGGGVRPGWEIGCAINYKNAGTTNLNPATVTVSYDSSKLHYIYALGATPTNTGNVLTLNTPPLTVESSGMFQAWFIVKTTAVIGDTITTIASITTGSVAAADSTKNPVRASLDPNDKSATPLLSPAQVSAGKFIDYLIRFQNTGNDTAFHVVVTDTLPAQVQPNTLEMIATSHLTKATIKGNAVSFEMRNILLPDSNVNEQASHGYVRFRVKPVNTLVAGSMINNKAAIYFDYNKPVITNTAITLIKNEAILPLTLVSFTARKQDNTNLLNWTTAQEINIDRFEIQRAAPLTPQRGELEFAAVGLIPTKALNSNNTTTLSYHYTDEPPAGGRGDFFYRLRMVDKDGKFTYSPIRIINNSGSFSVSIYPNPAKDKLQVMIDSERKTTLQMQVLSLNGKVLLSSSFTAGEGSILRSVNINTLPKGIYYLQVASLNPPLEGREAKFEKL